MEVGYHKICYAYAVTVRSNSGNATQQKYKQNIPQNAFDKFINEIEDDFYPFSVVLAERLHALSAMEDTVGDNHVVKSLLNEKLIDPSLH